VLDKEAILALMAGQHTVFHLATQCVRLSLFDPETVHASTRRHAECPARRVAAGVQRFVYVSSSRSTHRDRSTDG